jgi:short-subunit dehydrogenase/acyl dehydratase/acyl carrier protein
MLERADRTFTSFAAGDYVTFTRRFSAADFKAFEKLSGDSNPLHHDAAYASETRFKKPIVPIFLAASPLSAIAGTMLPGHRSLILSSSLRALAPVPYDMDIAYSAKVVSTLDAGSTLALRAIAFLGDQVLIDADLLVQVRDDVDASRAPAHDASVAIRRRNGKRALITGANGAIAGAVARALARAGWSLVLQQRGTASEALARDCNEYGVEIETMAADLEKPKDVEVLCGKLRGREDITAVIHTASPALDAPLVALSSVNDAALRSIASTLIPSMLNAQDGHVLFLGSSAVQHNTRGWEDYIAAKTAASHWTLALNDRYGRFGIAGTVVAPGYVRTRYSDRHRPAEAEALLPEEVAERVVACLSGEKGAGQYVWLEPNALRFGAFGFRGADAAHAATAPQAATPAKTAAPVATGHAVDDLVRAFFGAAPDADLSEAGIDRYPGWDSLRHFELMLHLEQELAIRFSSTDLERTTDMQRLRAVVAERQAQVRR